MCDFGQGVTKRGRLDLEEHRSSTATPQPLLQLCAQIFAEAQHGLGPVLERLQALFDQTAISRVGARGAVKALVDRLVHGLQRRQARARGCALLERSLDQATDDGLHAAGGETSEALVD